MFISIIFGFLCAFAGACLYSIKENDKNSIRKPAVFLPVFVFTASIFILLHVIHNLRFVYRALRIPFGVNFSYLFFMLFCRKPLRKPVFPAVFCSFAGIFSLAVIHSIVSTGLLTLPHLWVEFCALTLPVFMSVPVYSDGEHIPGLSAVFQVFFILTVPVYLFIICESVSNHAINILRPSSILLNLIIYLLAEAAVLSLCGVHALSFSLLFILVFLLGTANHFVLLFRNAPILPVDLLAVKTAASVAGKYQYRISPSLVFSAGLTVVLCITAFVSFSLSFHKERPVFTPKRALLRIAAICMSFTAMILFIRDYNLENHASIKPVLWNPTETFSEHGTAAALASFYQVSIVRKPHGYSAEDIKALLQSQQFSDPVSDGRPAAEVRPSVIVVMNESFADLSAIGPISCVKNDLSCLYSLANDPGTIEYGYNYVSTRGGETARSEFEFLTGFSLAYMPGTMPYLQYDLSDVPAAAANAANQGYRSYAMHPYYPDNWRRSAVYPKMGFERFFSMDDFAGYPLMTWDRVSDEGNYQKIIEVLEETKEPLFLYNVTLQNHGPYIPDGLNEAGYPLVDIDDTYRQFTDVQVYETLMDNSDKAFSKLLAYFRNNPKPVIVCFFGDHQAALNSDFEEKLLQLGVQPDDTELSLQEKYYTVPYVIWANYDVPRMGNSFISQTSTNYLGVLVQYYAGMQLCPFAAYLLTLRESIPVINSVGYKGADGVWYSLDEPSPYSEMIEQYKCVQYNGMFDTENNRSMFRINQSNP